MSVVRTSELTEGERAAARRLTASLGDLMRAAARAEVREEVWREVADGVDDLVRRLGPPVRESGVRPEYDAPADARARQVPLSAGAYHPFALPMELTFAPDGTSARGELTGDVLLEGPLGSVHGGVLAWAFDVVFGCLVQVQGRGALTRSLEVRYRRPTPLGVPLVFEAEVAEVSERRTTVVGTVSHDGTVTASATGDFVVPARS